MTRCQTSTSTTKEKACFDLQAHPWLHNQHPAEVEFPHLLPFCSMWHNAEVIYPADTNISFAIQQSSAFLLLGKTGRVSLTGLLLPRG